MVGNDVVDLADRDARSQTYALRFDARVFDRSERAAIERAGSPQSLQSPQSTESTESQRWRLWAAKEAAYKVARKENAGTVFTPARFGVRLDAAGHGYVEQVGHGHRLDPTARRA